MFIFKILTILLINQGYKIQSIKSMWNVFNLKCFQKTLIWKSDLDVCYTIDLYLLEFSIIA